MTPMKYNRNGKVKMDPKDIVLWEFLFQSETRNDKRLKEYTIEDVMSI